MKNGILTLHRADNYGAVLQAYALSSYVLNDLKKEVEIIDYFPPFMKGRYSIFGVDRSSVKCLFISIVYSSICLPFMAKKKKRFKKIRSMMPLSAKCYKYVPPKDTYDNYIVGSDQVWNLELTGYDKIYLLDFCDDKKKNSYAASIGMDNISSESREYLKKYLGTFKSLSVRERQGKEYLDALLGKGKVTQCIDPVFLLDKEKWNAMVGERLEKKPYIFIYSFNSEKIVYDIAKQFAEEMKCKIVSVTFGRNRRVYGVKANASWGPIEFLNMLKYSNMVLTDSFHGCAFSIIFQKEFYVYPYKGTSSRMLNLLEICRLKNRIIVEQNKLAKEKIDYGEVNQHLKATITKSKEYLEEIVV